MQILDDEVADSELLGHIDTNTGKVYPLLVVTKPEFMRGIDYRAPTKGISLVICNSFRNEREVQ